MTDKIEQVCTIPRTFREGNQSALDLVRATGVSAQDLTGEAVKAVLGDRPELVDDWFHWSEDQRASSGFYVAAVEDGYVVGRIPGDGSETLFGDRESAVAEFIVKHIGVML